MLHERTWADVDLAAITHNVAVVKAAVGDDVALMPVVKADAYGHGAVPVSWHLVQQGVMGLGVGDSAEALELRAAGITAPVLILGAVVPGEMEAVLRGRIDVTVHSGDRVRALRKAVRSKGGQVGIHLKVDTGMGRLGCHPERVAGIAREVKRSPRLHLRGIATHLATTTPDGGETAHKQLERFERVLNELEREKLMPRWRHAYASGAILGTLPDRFNLVRPGIAIYGIDPHDRKDIGLRPALAWRTQVVFLKDHRKGARIGYGGAWTAPRRSRIATLPVGYNDGYRFAMTNRAHVLVRGQRCPVVGRVSMDYVCVDVTHVPDAGVNDIVTLMGTDGESSITAADIAQWSNGIVHETLCAMGRRVRRRYAGG